MRSTGPEACIAVIAAVATLWLSPCAAQTEDDSPNAFGRSERKLKVSWEAKINLRHSDSVEFKLATPVPDDFLRPGEGALWLRTPDAGTSFELSDVSATLDYDFSPDASARVRVHAIDLYNRNPTSNDDRLFVREAWLRFGQRPDTLRPISGTGVFAQLGLAPRFTKQIARNLESYGLWGTAFGRLELLQLQLGGSVGSNVYWLGHVARRNPVFMRDPNALAGDNGTDRRVPGNNAPDLESGFPLLYDTYAPDLSADSKLEAGFGFGLRAVSEETRNGIDILGWYFQGEMSETVALRDTFYGGDLDILDAPPAPLPFAGNEKREIGATMHARLGALRLFGQYTDQSIAELERSGFEVEVAYRLGLGGLLVSGDQPVLNWLSLVFRFSNLDNRFAPPAGFVAPSMAWDWRKYDVGLRLGIMKGVDLTVEYARHDMIAKNKTFHPDEVLMSLRIGS